MDTGDMGGPAGRTTSSNDREMPEGGPTIVAVGIGFAAWLWLAWVIFGR
ncbi:MAG: hypothetical protein V4480_01585 [Patescibacteria group bacterium]